jgi:hypothetical protein
MNDDERELFIRVDGKPMVKIPGFFYTGSIAKLQNIDDVNPISKWGNNGDEVTVTGQHMNGLFKIQIGKKGPEVFAHPHNLTYDEPTPKPPKFPIGSRVEFKAMPARWAANRGVGTIVRIGDNNLFVVKLDDGDAELLSGDHLTAVDDESDVESDDDYRKRLLAVFEDMSLGFKLLLRAYQEQLSTSSGEVLDAYGADLGVTRRGTEGAKK